MENRNSSISSVIIRKNGENSCNNELALTQEKNGEEKNSNQMIIDDDAITSNNNCNNEDDKKPINNQQQGQPSMSNNANNNNRLKYGRVVILLENPILPAEMIENTPSKADNLDPLIENDLRITGCKLIQISGILLRLPQVAMATGQVLFQRFYYNKSFVRQSMEITAMACVVLASKVEEAPRRIRDIINVFHNMKQIRLKQPITPILLDENYIHLKNQIIKSERRILKELGFCVHVKHPHKFIVAVAQILKNEHNSQLIQTAWSYMNDSLQTNVFVRYPPETIACACIHLSSRVLRVPLPTRPLWYELFNVTSENIEDICKSILMLYTRKPLDQEELEAIVEKAKQKLDEEKLKARVLLAQRNNQLSVNDVAINSPQTIDSRSNSPSVIILNKNNSDNKASNDKVISEEKDVNNLPNNSEIEKQDDKSDHSTNSSSSLKLQKSPLKSNEKEKSSMKRLLEDQHEEERYHNSSDDQQIYKTYRTKKDGHSITSNNYKEYNDYDDNCPDDHLRLKKDIYPKRDNRSPQIPRSYISSKIVDTNSYRRERDTRDRNHYHYRNNIRSRSRSRSPNDQSPYDQSYVSSSSSSSSKVTNHHHHYYYDNRHKDKNRLSSSKNRSSNDYEPKYFYDDEVKNSSNYNRYHHSNHRRYEYREKKRDYSPTNESQSSSSSSRYHHNSYGEKY